MSERVIKGAAMEIFKKLFGFLRPEKEKENEDTQNPVTDVFQRVKGAEKKKTSSKTLEKKFKVGQAKPQLPTKSVAQQALRGKTPLDRFVAELKEQGIKVSFHRNVPLVDTGLVKRGQNDQFVQMANRLLPKPKLEKMRNLLIAEANEELSEELNVLLPSGKIDLHILGNYSPEEREAIFQTVKTTRYKILSQVLERPITLIFVDPQNLDSGSKEVTVTAEAAKGEAIRIVVPKTPYLDETPLATD